jgi:hypothetical protein
MLGSTGAKVSLQILILILVPSIVFALGVHVSFNKNTESDLAGYLVYCGTSSGNYERIVGADLSASVDMRGLDAGRTYYFAVTARDKSGNQSKYSQEVVITIPAQVNTNTGTGTNNNGDTGSGSDIPAAGGNGTGTDTGSGGIIGSAIDRVEQLLRELLGLGPDDPLYTLSSSSGGQTQSASLVPSSALTINKKSSSEKQSLQSEPLEKRYPVRDAILRAFTPFDLKTIYPEGIFIFYPLEKSCPDIDGDMITIDTPGRYLYMVFDELGDVSHVLRISVAEEIFQMQTYNPKSSLLLEDDVFGIAIQVPASATMDAKPIAIGWGGTDLFSGSSQLVRGERAVFFDILPYGLELDEQAKVSVPYNGGAEPCVQLYDDKTGTWVTMEDTSASGGYVTFSTQVFGRFKITDQPSEQAQAKGNNKNGDHDGACFIDASRGGWGYDWCILNLVTMVALLSCASSRMSSAR